MRQKAQKCPICYSTNSADSGHHPPEREHGSSQQRQRRKGILKRPFSTLIRKKWTTQINLVLKLNLSPYQQLATNLLEFVEECDHAVDRLCATRSTGVENAYKLDILVRAVHLQHFPVNAMLAQVAKQLPRPAFLEITGFNQNKLRQRSTT